MTATPDVMAPEPHAGFWKARLRRNGPWVPIAIWWHEGARDDDGALMEDEDWRCHVAGKPANAYRVWERHIPYARSITRSEYAYLTRLCVWARENAPADAYARPDQSIDLNRQPPLF